MTQNHIDEYVSSGTSPTRMPVAIHGQTWASIQPEVRMLRASENVGRAISWQEETDLLEACRASRSRSLFPAVLIALNTCMRYSELRLLRWSQVDLKACTLTVGESKTESGTGRLLPLNDRAVAILGFCESLPRSRIKSFRLCSRALWGFWRWSESCVRH
jgi:integrase